MHYNSVWIKTIHKKQRNPLASSTKKLEMSLRVMTIDLKIFSVLSHNARSMSQHEQE